MNVNFALTDEQYIRKQVEEGHYTTANELVRDAVRRLREATNNSRKTKTLWDALEEGEADIRAGRTVSYTPTFLDECEQRARENVRLGIKPNPDVCA